ncbi:hypothetical protein ACOMHN_062436 [Nucella lapillus]
MKVALPPVAGTLNLLLKAVEFIEGARGTPADDASNNGAAPPPAFLAARPAVLPVRKRKQNERVIPQEEKEQAQELLEKLEMKPKETGKMCTICSADEYRTFTTVSSLINHLRSKHLGLKMFKCDDCDEHQRKHTGEKPFHCDECADVAFRTYGMYKRHLKTVHNSILTWRGKAPMSEEELAKVKTKEVPRVQPQHQKRPMPGLTLHHTDVLVQRSRLTKHFRCRRHFKPLLPGTKLRAAEPDQRKHDPIIQYKAPLGVVAGVSPQRSDSQPSMSDVQLVASTP